jgi:hypothetical protein
MRESIRRCAGTAAAAAVAVLLSSCNGGAGAPGSGALPQSGAPAAAPLAAMLPDALAPVWIAPGKVDGLDNRFTPADGDTASGGQGRTIDGLPCAPSMVTNEYHVHMYLGIVYNGKLIATPDGIGLYKAGPESNGYINSAQCYYSIHTHDASGMIHLEVPEKLPYSSVVFKLKDVLDVWGVPHDATSFGPFNGPIHVFVGNVPLKTTVVSHYAARLGKYGNIKIHSHTVVWLEIGNAYYAADKLPPVRFYTEY